MQSQVPGYLDRHPFLNPCYPDAMSNTFSYRDTMTIAEESTAWPGVTQPTDGGGLGFGLKWDMGWMNDTLSYIGEEPIHRRWHHNELTFRMVYAFNEHFMLPLSHDEVVHGKGSLLERQPGDRWQKFAGLRLLFGYQYGIPGKKLMFMGSEFGDPYEWDHERELPWGLLQHPEHSGVLDWVGALNRVYRSEPSLHRVDASPSGFTWIIGDDAENSVLAFMRHAPGERSVLVVCNFTPRSSPRLSHWGTTCWHLARAAQRRRRGLWRQRPAESRGRCRRRGLSWP